MNFINKTRIRASTNGFVDHATKGSGSPVLSHRMDGLVISVDRYVSCSVVIIVHLFIAGNVLKIGLAISVVRLGILLLEVHVVSEASHYQGGPQLPHPISVFVISEESKLVLMTIEKALMKGMNVWELLLNLLVRYSSSICL